jgi:hypothetical protein
LEACRKADPEGTSPEVAADVAHHKKVLQQAHMQVGVA